MYITKKKGSKFDQKIYDYFFHNIEYNLREMGFGDVTVNKKMKELNKILYDILLKLSKNDDIDESFKINPDLVSKYFNNLNDIKSTQFVNFETYFKNFYHFCFEIPVDNMIEGVKKFRY